MKYLLHLDSIIVCYIGLQKLICVKPHLRWTFSVTFSLLVWPFSTWWSAWFTESSFLALANHKSPLKMWLVQGQLQLEHTCSIVLSTWRGSLTLRLMDGKSAGHSVWWPVRPHYRHMWPSIKSGAFTGVIKLVCVCVCLHHSG